MGEGISGFLALHGSLWEVLAILLKVFLELLGILVLFALALVLLLLGPVLVLLLPVLETLDEFTVLFLRLFFWTCLGSWLPTLCGPWAFRPFASCARRTR